jgi:phage baseplate assembly protein W
VPFPLVVFASSPGDPGEVADPFVLGSSLLGGEHVLGGALAGLGEDSEFASALAGPPAIIAYALAQDSEVGWAPRPGPARLAALAQLDDRVPHLVFPLRQAPSGALAVLEQDTLDDVRQCVHVLMLTPLGYRPLAPEVGIADPTFTAGIDAAELESQLEEQEARARVTVATPGPDAGGQQQVVVRVALVGDEEGA